MTYKDILDRILVNYAIEDASYPDPDSGNWCRAIYVHTNIESIDSLCEKYSEFISELIDNAEEIDLQSMQLAFIFKCK